MRKRIFRTVLPLMAFMLAAAFAFATDQKPSEDGAQTGEYIFLNGRCESVTRGCNNLSTTPCKYEEDNVEYQVFRENHVTYCSVQRFHQP